MIFGLVESVIAARADRPDEDADALFATILYSCLRVLGHNGEAGRRISEHARERMNVRRAGSATRIE